MNAALLTKPAKGLILASGFLAASSVLGFAQDAPVALGAQATLPLGTLYVSAPAGVTTLGCHSFDLSAGNILTLGNGQSATFAGSWTNANNAFLLLNTFNTYWWYQDSVVGNVTFTFSDGTTQSTDLTVGGNVREWRTGAGFTVNTLSDPAAANVWTGSAQPTMGGGTAVIDMLSITLPSKTVTSVTINDVNSFGALQIDLAGLTIDPVNPTPTASCIRPGNSCTTPAAQNSQAWKWQTLQPGTTTNTNPHAQNGDKTTHGHKSH